jgi:HlyD family secretion protein
MSSTTASGKKRFRVPPIAILLVALVAIVAIVAFFVMKPKGGVEPYRTQAVSRGAITKSVSSSGTLQALITVDVGSQISGQLKEVLVDFDDRVAAGQVLARIDPQTQESRLESARAELQATTQSVNSAEANLAQTVANTKLTEADYNRTKALFAQGIVAPQALEKAEAQLDVARAQVRVSEASVKSARARLTQSQATVRSNQIDLGRTVITSPITGVVVDRKVDVGSTVAASLNAPVLFKIAQDLSKLELKILVDEADIGQVQVGQQVNFTVDAFPQDRFVGVIKQVRKQPETAQNVVAYVVIAEAENPGEKLLPGMTANAEITLERHTNVLRVPTAALRWSPPDPNAQPAGRGGHPGMGGPGFGAGRGGPPGGFGGGRGGPNAAGGRGGAGRGNPIFVYDQLDLNDQQLIKLNSLMEDTRKATSEVQAKMQKEMQRGGTVDRQAFQKEMQEAQRSLREEMDKVLTPAQTQRMQQIQAGRPGGQRGQVYVLRDGKPFRIGVGIGVTDGQNTQVISNAFKQGDVVIVSGGGRAAAGG